MDRIGNPVGDTFLRVVADRKVAGRLPFRKGRIMRYVTVVGGFDIGGQFRPRVIHRCRNRVVRLVDRQREFVSAVEDDIDRGTARSARFIIVQVEVHDIVRRNEFRRFGRGLRPARRPAPTAAFGHGDGISRTHGPRQHEPGIGRITFGVERGRLGFHEHRGNIRRGAVVGGTAPPENQQERPEHHSPPEKFQ